jgi:hypothetical protein
VSWCGGDFMGSSDAIHAGTPCGRSKELGRWDSLSCLMSGGSANMAMCGRGQLAVRTRSRVAYAAGSQVALPPGQAEPLDVATG